MRRRGRTGWGRGGVVAEGVSGRHSSGFFCRGTRPAWWREAGGGTIAAVRFGLDIGQASTGRNVRGLSCGKAAYRCAGVPPTHATGSTWSAEPRKRPARFARHLCHPQREPRMGPARSLENSIGSLAMPYSGSIEQTRWQVRPIARAARSPGRPCEVDRTRAAAYLWQRGRIFNGSAELGLVGRTELVLGDSGRGTGPCSVVTLAPGPRERPVRERARSDPHHTATGGASEQAAWHTSGRAPS